MMGAAGLQGGSRAHGATPLQALVEMDSNWVQPERRDACHMLPSALMLTFEGQEMAARVEDVSTSSGLWPSIGCGKQAVLAPGFTCGGTKPCYCEL